MTEIVTKGTMKRTKLIKSLNKKTIVKVSEVEVIVLSFSRFALKTHQFNTTQFDKS